MTDVISTTYTKDNCVCYDCYYNDVILAVRMVPNDRYVLKRTFEENEETYVTYTSGFVLINMNRIDEMFPQFETILRTDVPEGEFIQGVTEPTETI